MVGSPAFYPSLFSPSEDDDDHVHTRRWENIKYLLQANPTVISLELLLSLLKQRPPTGVVKLLLSHSPDHLLLPKNGPTPLQVAVQEGCNVDVVRLLIQACPWALCVTNLTAEEDPLSIAKRLSKQDLVTVLQRPLVHWLGEREQPCLVQKHSSSIQQEEQEDLNNVKLLCARLLKRNQQLSKDVKNLQTTIQAIQSENRNVTTKENIAKSTDQPTTAPASEWEIRWEEEATWNEVVRNDLMEWKEEVQEELLALRQSRRDGNDENKPPPVAEGSRSERNIKGPMSDRPKPRRCRPFNSIK